MEFTQKLISTKWGTLLTAILAAAAAGIVLIVYLDRYRSEVRVQGTPVTVLVARSNIAKGTSGTVVASNGLYSAMTIREGQLKEGAISDPMALEGKVATREIYEGAQLTIAAFADADTSLAASLTANERVVSLPFDSAHGMTASIEVGNRVDVYAGFNVVPLKPDGTPVQGGQARALMRMIVENVPVAAVGEKGNNGSTDVSLKVDDLQAAQLAFAAENGKLWLSLRPSAGAKPSRDGIVSVETLLLGVPPVNVVKSLGGVE